MTHDPEQAANIERVSARIAERILEFVDRRKRGCYAMKIDADFAMEELRSWIHSRVGEVAPDSPGRILRDLRAKRLINYEVIDRAASRYRIVPVVPLSKTLSRTASAAALRRGVDRVRAIQYEQLIGDVIGWLDGRENGISAAAAMAAGKRLRERLAEIKGPKEGQKESDDSSNTSAE